MSLGNALGGAASGAAIGSAAGPGWGTAIGAGVGFLGGLLGGDNSGPTDEQKRLNAQYDAQIAYLQRIARGEDSVSAEQLRQGLQQNLGAQRSMAAGASPQNQAMANIQASRNAMTLGAGLAGQQAVAGMQERQQAQMALSQMLAERRAQEQAVGPAATWLQKWGPAIGQGATLYAQTHGRQQPDPSQRQAPQPTPTPYGGNMDQMLGRTTNGPIRY